MIFLSKEEDYKTISQLLPFLSVPLYFYLQLIKRLPVHSSSSLYSKYLSIASGLHQAGSLVGSSQLLFHESLLLLAATLRFFQLQYHISTGVPPICIYFLMWILFLTHKFLLDTGQKPELHFLNWALQIFVSSPFICTLS